jgi:ACS family sodium-dependent inorganic phosphate cotransporter
MVGKREVVTAAGSVNWPKRYTVVGLCFLAAFVCYIDRVNISVAVLAMQDEFGWTETTKGLVLSAFFVGYMLFQVPSGWLASRHGGKLVLGGAVVWWSLFTIATPAAAFVALPALIAARILMGLGEAAMFPGSYSLLTRWVPTSERSRAIGVLLSGIPLGTLFALTTTGWIIGRFGWPSVFYLFGAAGLVWCIAWFAIVVDSPRRHPTITQAELSLLDDGRDEASTTPDVPWRRLFAVPAVWALIINHFASNWILYVLLAWLPSYFRSTQGLSIAGAGLFSAAPWLTMFVMTNVAAWSADALVARGTSLTTVRKLMQVLGLVGAAAFLLFAKDATTPGAALIFMCGALGMLAFTWSGYAPNHMEIAPRHAAVLVGITNTAGTIPGIIGVAVTGWTVEVTGTYSAAFVLAAAVSITGALIWLCFGTSRQVVE